MKTPAQAFTAPSAAHCIGGRRLEAGSSEFADAIAAAHARRQRPRCLCRPEGAEMYIARLDKGYILKRMPDTGSSHAPSCPSYEPPADTSEHGQVLGRAIVEHPATGRTTLRLDFSLTKLPGRSTAPIAQAEVCSVSSGGAKLSLRGLLHYLWDQAELTRWHPGFAGRRSWFTVRKHLLKAAELKTVSGGELASRLYIPEVFCVEDRQAIGARRLTQWQQAVARPGKPQRLMLLIGELKELLSTRLGFKVIVKHMPELALPLDDQPYRRLERRFEGALALWGASDDVHLVMIATFGIGAAGVPLIHQLHLMPVNRHWLPVDDAFEKQLVDRLVSDKRSFIKGLRYNLGPTTNMACAALTDCEGPTPLLFIVPDDSDANFIAEDSTDALTAPWMWRTSCEQMPPIPSANRRAFYSFFARSAAANR